MIMPSREHLLTVLNNERPDCLPYQIHDWMPVCRDGYLNSIDCYKTYEMLDMDYVIYSDPEYKFSEQILTNWIEKTIDTEVDATGNKTWQIIIKKAGRQLENSLCKKSFPLAGRGAFDKKSK